MFEHLSSCEGAIKIKAEGRQAQPSADDGGPLGNIIALNRE
jgi:hypothetical protein